MCHELIIIVVVVQRGPGTFDLKPNILAIPMFHFKFSIPHTKDLDGIHGIILSYMMITNPDTCFQHDPYYVGTVWVFLLNKTSRPESTDGKIQSMAQTGSQTREL